MCEWVSGWVKWKGKGGGRKNEVEKETEKCSSELRGKSKKENFLEAHKINYVIIKIWEIILIEYTKN